MKFIDDVSIEQYDDFVKKNSNCNIFQSPNWVKIKNTWDYKRVAVIDENNTLIATAQILIRSGLWYLARGPILDYSNNELLDYFLKNLKIYAKKNKAKLLKIDIPEPLKNEKLNLFKEATQDNKKNSIMSIFKKNRFKHKGFTLNMSDTIQPRFEAATYLSEDIENLFPKHTRRLIRDANKKMVEIKQTDKENIDDLMFALSCTEQRKKIKLRNKEYFENIFDTYGENCLIFTAYLDLATALEKYKKTETDLYNDLNNLKENMHKKKRMIEEQLLSVHKSILFMEELLEKTDKTKHILCSAISIKYGNSSEMIYAGMNDIFSKIPAQYGVYSTTMKKFYEMGAMKTSMGGIEGTLNDSLLLFKSHFNPNIVEYYGEFDFAFSKLYSLMYNYGLPLRRKILKLIKK